MNQQDVSQILAAIPEMQDHAVVLWHENRSVQADDPLLASVLQQHRTNYDLWHLEDFARRTDVAAQEIADTKRMIDRTNQLRNDLMEQLDRDFLSALANPNPHAPLHSETFGMMLDRLSILSLKLFHTGEELERTSAGAEHVRKNIDRKRMLAEQRLDLSDCLMRVWRQTVAGELRIKLYRQLKMYNDPTLNPQIYQRRAVAGMETCE